LAALERFSRQMRSTNGSMAQEIADRVRLRPLLAENAIEQNDIGGHIKLRTV
jgi:hypothetical protein